MAIRCVLLVATDGLYDMLSNERAVNVAFAHWGDPASAAVELVKEAGESHNRIFICSVIDV